MTSTPHTHINRVSAGLPGAGRFAPGSFSEPGGFELPPSTPVQIFNESLEESRGAELADQLQALPPAGVLDRLRASDQADILREACPDYWPAGTDATDAHEALAAFRQAIPNLSDERAAHHTELVGFAVTQEVKHLGNREHILATEYDWETLIDTSEYRTNDDLIDRGNEANGDAWGQLADTAMVAALGEDSAAAATSLRLTA